MNDPVAACADAPSYLQILTLAVVAFAAGVAVAQLIFNLRNR